MLNAKVRRFAVISVLLFLSACSAAQDKPKETRVSLPKVASAFVPFYPSLARQTRIQEWSRFEYPPMAENFRCLRGKRTALAGDCGEGKRENVAIRAARAHELRGQISLQTLGLQVRFRMQLWERGKAVGRSAVAGGRGSERGKSDALRSRSGDTAQELTPKSHASFENRNFADVVKYLAAACVQELAHFKPGRRHMNEIKAVDPDFVEFFVEVALEVLMGLLECL